MSRCSRGPRDPSAPFFQVKPYRTSETLVYFRSPSLWQATWSMYDKATGMSFSCRCGLFGIWWGETCCALNSMELESRLCHWGKNWQRAWSGIIARLLGLGTESCRWNLLRNIHCSYSLPERCIRGLLLRRHGPHRRSLPIHLRRGHRNQPLWHLHPDHLWHGQRQHHLRPHLLNRPLQLNPNSFWSIRLTRLEPHQRQLNICLDNLRHYILRGLLRPYVAFFDLASTDSFHYAATVIRFPCNSPSCSTSSTPCTCYYFTFEPWYHIIAHQPTSFCNSNGTHVSDNLTHCSTSIQRTDNTTYTSTRITVPTPCPAITTIGYYDIDYSSSCTSIHGSQSSSKGSIRKETGQTTPFSCKGFFGFTSCCTSRASFYTSIVYLSRSGKFGLYNTTTCRICPSHSSSTADDPWLPTPSRTTTTTSSSRFTTNRFHSSDTITYIDATYTYTYHNASTIREGPTHWTYSPWSHYYVLNSTGTQSSVADITIAKTPFQNTEITVPTINYTFSSPTSSSSTSRPTSFPSASTSILNQTSQRSPNTFPLPTTSPPRRRSPPGPRRHRSNPPPRSRTPLRHPQGHEVILRPAARPSDPTFIPIPDADDSWGEWNHSHYPTDHHRHSTRPRSPVGPPPPEPSSTPPAHVTAPLGAVAFRLPDGDSENSEAAAAFSISQFDKNDIEVSELNAAAADPHRVRCLTELDPNHTVPLRTVLDQPTKILFNNFVDEMFSQLAKPYRTMNDDLVFIKASQATVMNITRAFAQARLLDLNLARRTQAFYVEPENLLTITVPTGLPKKPIYRGEHAGTYIWATTKRVGNQLPKS